METRVEGEGIINYSFMLSIDLFNFHGSEYCRMFTVLFRGNNALSYHRLCCLKRYISCIYGGITSTLDYIKRYNVNRPYKLSVLVKDTCFHESESLSLRHITRRSISSHFTERKQINADKSFKSDKCVICLTNPPNVLFCDCGHIAICVECDKKRSFVLCPICKIENTIKRTI